MVLHIPLRQCISLKISGMKELDATLKLVIPLEGDLTDYYMRDRDFMFSGTKADFTFRARAMIHRHRGFYKSPSYKPGVYHLAASLRTPKFGKSFRT